MTALLELGDRTNSSTTQSARSWGVDGQTTTEDAAPLRIGFVNNMPDGAFSETERQFRALLAAGAGTRSVLFRRYWIPGVPRGPAVRQVIAQHYRELGYLYLDPPDALIVTGTEPRAADLRNEPYWESLACLLRWAETSVASTLLSCLAAHAALAVFHALPRTPLPHKCSGVFRQLVSDHDPLGRALGDAAFPHSRHNEVPTAQVAKQGYRIVAEGPTSGWTVAAKQRGRCLFVLLQGHPEYAPTTLLREYRRDVRRFLAGERSTYPELPAAYLDQKGQQLLEVYRWDRARDSSVEFPFEAASDHIQGDWAVPAAQLAANWLDEVSHSVAPVQRPTVAPSLRAS